MSIKEEFLSSNVQPASSWRVLLGVLSSLTPLVTGGCLRMDPSPLLLGSGGRLLSGPVGRLLPSECLLVAGSDSSGGGGVSITGVPEPRLLVRRGLGRSLGGVGRFGPLVSGGGLSLHQCQGALSCRAGSSPLRGSFLRVHGGGFRGQLHCRGLSAEGRGHPFARSQFHCAANFLVGGGSPHCSRSAVHYEEEQGAGGCPIHAQSDPGLGGDSEDGGLSRSLQEVTGDGRLVCHLVKSLLFTLFFALPRSESLGDGCAPPVLERSSGVRLPTLGPDSPCAQEAPFVIRGVDDSDSSLLASAALVPGASGAPGGWCSCASIVSRSSQTASFPPSLSGDPQAVSSCLVTIQHFTRAEGFSALVAAQLGFARRSSSRTNYQVKLSVYRKWCRAGDHFISRSTLPKIADFLFWLRRSKKLSVSSILGYRSMLSTVIHFKLPEISSASVLRDLIRSFKVEAPVRAIGPPSWNLDLVLHFLNSSTFEPLALSSLCNLTKKVLFLISLDTAKSVGELQAVSRYVSFVASDACVSYVPEFVAKTESSSNYLPRSFLV